MSSLERWKELRILVRDAVLGSPGHTTGELRREIAEGRGPGGGLGALLARVRLHAYRTTDDEVAALRAAGESDDRLFEMILAAAVGDAERRLALGLAALEGDKQ